MRAYPHQLSGGQRQRAMIAMALALEPAVLVADEPTTALDVTTQAQILKLIRDLQRRRNMAVMFITHDFGVVADIADRVVVLQHGKVVEQGAAADVLHAPAASLYARAARRRADACSRRSARRCSTVAKAVEVVGLDKTYVCWRRLVSQAAHRAGGEGGQLQHPSGRDARSRRRIRFRKILRRRGLSCG